MDVGSSKRSLSFNLLAEDISGDDDETLFRSVSDLVENMKEKKIDKQVKSLKSRKRQNRNLRKKEKRGVSEPLIEEDHFIEPDVDLVWDPNCSVVSEKTDIIQQKYAFTVTELVETELQNSNLNCLSFVELRQRNGIGNVCEQIGSTTSEIVNQEKNGTLSSSGKCNPEVNGSRGKLETVRSLDWKKLMSEDSNYYYYVEKLPLKYFLGEIYGGYSLRGTTSVGNDKKRQRVYNTMFHVPWRCELLIDVGFFVCLDSFLSLLTIMPSRILMMIWKLLTISGRQLQRPCAAELSDFGCFILLVSGVTVLQAADISLIYHIIRGQGTIKLYVVYNVLEVFDKLCQSFGDDVLQVLFDSAEGLANCSTESVAFVLMRFILDQMIAIIAFIVHSFILLAQAVTLATCIVAHNNALLALLVSNNFAEIKSNVFKRLSKENLQYLAHHDTVERFHITAFVLFVLAQNILEAEGPWFGNFLYDALLVYLTEIFIDVIKHSFLAKFNEIKPVAYSEFLEDLCKQILEINSDDRSKSLTFIPVAPACVVIRVLTPIYASYLPPGPLLWRLFWILIFSSVTYVFLITLKIIVGMGLRLHAQWYVNRCLKRKHHLHLD